MAQGALDGLRLIEAGQLIAGPFCGQLMADHGCEVIKVEPPADPSDPGAGDPMRQWGRGKPVWYPVIGRNKKTITLNLRDPRGQELLRRLVRKSDFMLENFRPGTMEKWGLGYEALAAENPGLIMIRVSGFGQTGPYAPRAGYGSIGEAMGGIRNLAGDPSSPPSRVGISIGDSLAATFACLGAMMALHHRHRTGEGQVVDSAIYEAVLAMMESTVPEYTEGGYTRERTGSILPEIAPSNVYPCTDGEILIAANQDSVFARLCEAMERPDLATDPRYATHHARGARQAELDALIADWTRGFSAADLLALMDAHGVPAGKIYKAPDMLDDPHFKAREALVKVAHPQFRNLWMQNVFPKLSATPGKVNWPGQPIGAHTDSVYHELLGLSDDDIAGLRQEGVI
ncbi:CaiB/BaiF CoA transferase family protein [Sandaracinobacteroides sp. A072]|uniref:CaiB/BaiF CoA transferase family protein n=1 Tax=Sandaracinobacteroides sp. A072 TaxID=3461146 RepID=UPI004042CFB0